MARHGPHHGAQKSMSTGRSLVTTPSKVPLVTCTIELFVSFTVIDHISSPRLRRTEPRPGFPAQARLWAISNQRVVHKSTCASTTTAESSQYAFNGRYLRVDQFWYGRCSMAVSRLDNSDPDRRAPDRVVHR